MWLGLRIKIRRGGHVDNPLRRPLAVALVLAAIVLVSGCSEDRVRPSDDLPPLPSTSASASPTEDAPGATGYPLPEEARAYTPEGARAFFDYFIAVVNASTLANDPEPIREISQGCEYCDELSQRFDESAQSGIRIVGGALVLTSVGEVVLGAIESGAVGAGMAFVLIQQPQQAFDVSGNLISDTPELQAVGSLELAYLADERDWLVNLLSVVVQ